MFPAASFLLLTRFPIRGPSPGEKRFVLPVTLRLDGYRVVGEYMLLDRLALLAVAGLRLSDGVMGISMSFLGSASGKSLLSELASL